MAHSRRLRGAAGLAELSGFAAFFGLFWIVGARNSLVSLMGSVVHRAEVAVVKTLPLAGGAFVWIIECQDVSARDHSEEGRQRAPLL